LLWAGGIAAERELVPAYDPSGASRQLPLRRGALGAVQIIRFVIARRSVSDDVAIRFSFAKQTKPSEMVP